MQLFQPFRALEPVTTCLFVAWWLSLCSVPLIQARFGLSAFYQSIFVGVVCQLLIVVWLLIQLLGLGRTLTVAFGVMSLAWLAEAVGTNTGQPFGVYSYTTQLQPQWQQVPLLIPLAWLMMLPPAWALAVQITGRPDALVFPGVAALAFTCWDLYLDPQMVLWGLWTWHEPGGYFGIPWQNFFGWLLVAYLITLGMRPIFAQHWQNRVGAIQGLVAVYAITCIMQFVAQLCFWNLPGPALVGFAAMGSLTAWAWWCQRSRSTNKLSS